MSKLRKTGFNLKPGERLDDLVRNDLKIIQRPGSFCFSIDAVLLANFASVKKGDLIVDLGTGSGVIPILLTTRQQVDHIIGIDIQAEAVDRAVRSVTGNGLQGLITIREGDIRNASAELGLGKFDLVTANPPYLPAGQGKINLNKEIALARHELCCSMEDVLREGARLLNSNGRLAMVHRPERMVDIIFTMKRYGLEPKRLQLVYPALGKKPNILLIEAIKGAMPGLEALEPLLVYDEQGNYTKELMEIYYPGR
ncbi:type 11 methyltransferase [Thermincola ferriacetica]|uniref:Type 11 methyltransferase n=1 Tax=Thermincola ferriacetica TaxID=281456 RepID=A0A0L6W0S3_9FIRM|nr:tRNA1(Val) (adenine(37)-N6)-methyltransferase [Thermincola ferriacetica]KNZ69182.1 type 11 methyltransferase [Thermincola ferriacetica]